MDMAALQNNFVKGLKMALTDAQPTVGEVYQSEDTQQIISNFRQHAQK